MSNQFLSARRGDIDMRGFEVVREQFFNFIDVKSVTFSYAALRFSPECLRKLNCVEYVELFIHPIKKTLAVRACAKEIKRAMRWITFDDGKPCSREIGGAAFLGTMYELFEWNPENKYRFRGAVREINGEQIIEFDLNEPEIVDKNNILYRDDWYDRFGIDYYSHVKSDNTLSNNTDVNVITYNIEPNIFPTEPEILRNEIDEIINKMLNSEVNDDHEPRINS